MDEERIQYLDVARTIAIISITFNHAVNRSFAISSGQYEEFVTIPLLVTIIKTVLYAFSRIGVPLFLLISGALLLPRNYERGGITRFIKHNWLQLLVTTEMWLAIMFWYKQILPKSVLKSHGIGYCFIHFIMTLLFLNPITMGSMWYMEMILCVYLLIPILSTALKRLDHKFFIIPIAIVTFCSYILPDVNGVLATLGIKETIKTTLDSANVFSMYIALLLMGYFITNDDLFLTLKTKHVAIICGFSFIAFCALQFWVFSREYDFVVGKNYKDILIAITALFTFELIRRIKIKEKTSIITTYISRISFGIYFIHICIMEGLKAVINYFYLDISYLEKFLVLESVSFFGSILIIKFLTWEKLSNRYDWIKWIDKNVLGIK